MKMSDPAHTLDLQVGDIFLAFILVAIVSDLIRQWLGG